MVTMGKKWRFADKDLKNADWCFETPLLPLCTPNACHPERQRGISLFFKYFHSFPTPPLRPYCAGINFISFRRLLLRRQFLEGPSFYKYRRRGSLASSLKLPTRQFLNARSLAGA